jgi:hypothetical protein
MNPLFGVLILERDPFTLANLPGLAQAWVIDAGGFAAVGMIIYLLYALLTPTENTAGAKERAGIPKIMLLCGIAALFLYVVAGVMLSRGIGEDPNRRVEILQPGYTYFYKAPVFDKYPRAMVMTVAGLLAIVGFGTPFLQACLRLKWGRIYSLAKLCVLETIRNKIFYIFLASLLIYLVPIKWFNNSIKPEDELRSLFTVPYIVMQFVTLACALLIVSFSIPNDINRQTIYTIVTKPVERLEILLGKFLGYLFVLSVGLALMVVAGVLFISSTSIDEQARKETKLARVPVRGELEFRSRKADFEGTLVGREFEYRKYISGDITSPQRAVWNYDSLPASLETEKAGVKCEFTFDIFRLTKGEENKGIFCQIVVATHQCPQVPPKNQGDGYWKWKDEAREEEYRKEAVKLLSAATGREENVDSIRGLIGSASPTADDELGRKIWAVAETLAEKYGYFEWPSVEVYDYHPASIVVPAGLFKNARAGTPGADARGTTLPRLQVFVKCESRSQLIGMAKGDLYILEGINSFEANYLRSMFGLWCRIAILIAICLSLSTYLSGVVSMLTGLMIYVGGYASEHIDDVGRGTSVGGGPIQSFASILKAEPPTVVQSEPGVIQGGDSFFLWIIRRVQNVLPDLESLGWSHFVKEGFNVSYEYLVLNLIVTVAYILPWFVLAFYLMRSREVADT